MTTRERKHGAPSGGPHAECLDRLFRFHFEHPIFSVRVTGNCMEPYVFHGDVCAVDQGIAPEDGHFVMVESLDLGYLLKKYSVERSGAVLVATNDPTIRIPVDERVRVIGVVDWIIVTLPDRHGLVRQRPDSDSPAVTEVEL